MRLATWNLARPAPAGIRTTRLCTHMAAIAADVWVLTETHRDVSPGSGFRLAAHSESAPDRPADERWTAIWVRDEIEATQTATHDAERTACVKMTTRSGQSLFVYGTVLPWLTDDRHSHRKGSDAFIEALAEQEADWLHIRRSEPDAGLCVTGDLNQDLLPTGHVYGSRAGRSALRSALLNAGLTCVTGEASDPLVSLGKGLASVDHICVGGIPLPNTPPQVWPTHDELGSRLTDHHGVAVDLC